MTDTANPAPTRDAILEVIEEADEPLQPKEISERSGRPKDSVQKALGKLVDAGTLVKPAYGKYALPSPETGGTDLDAPETPDELTALFRDEATLTVYTDVEVEAGNGRVVYPDESRHQIEIPRHFISRILGFSPPRKVGLMTATGDSMRPTIRDGDLILFNPAVRQVEGGGIYVLLIDDRQLVKRVQSISGGGYRIISDNDFYGYKDERLVPADEDGDTLVNEETGRAVTPFRVVGSVLYPRRDTDQMPVKQVAELIRGMVNGDPMNQLRTQKS